MTGKGTSADPYRFDDDIPGGEEDQWSMAYAYCRDIDKPTIAQVGNVVARIFPSGAYRFVRIYGETATTA